MFDTLKKRFKELFTKVSETKKEYIKEEPFTDGILGWRITEKKLDELLDDIEMILCEADVALEVVDTIKNNLRSKLINKKIKIGTALEKVVYDTLKETLHKVLDVKSFNLDEYIKTNNKPVIIMFVGVNGTGKTTAIAKLIHRYKKLNYECVIAAGDTFRAGAIEQLERHAEKLGVKLIKHTAGADPAAVAFDAIEHAIARKKDIVFIDTAGRMQTNINLMDEMKKIKRVAKPNLVIFVGDALTGNDAINQARKFNEAVNIDGMILTKIDTDAKGGAALSVARAIGKPVLFVGTGQGYDDLLPFDKSWLVERIFE